MMPFVLIASPFLVGFPLRRTHFPSCAPTLELLVCDARKFDVSPARNASLAGKSLANRSKESLRNGFGFGRLFGRHAPTGLRELSDHQRGHQARREHDYAQQQNSDDHPLLVHLGRFAFLFLVPHRLGPQLSFPSTLLPEEEKEPLACETCGRLSGSWE